MSEKVISTHEIDASNNGLSPSEAFDWLELQQSLAWKPEAVGIRLREGMSPREVLSHLRGQLELLPPDVAAGEFGGARRRDDLGDDRRGERRLRECERLALRVVPLTDPAYPRPLAELVDAPPVLLVRGRVRALAGPGIAIVGARAATRAARETARRLARELAATGLVIVSGLARGVDAEAHRGALEANGTTVGVLACGLNQVYPPEHRELAQEMTLSGAVISEMPLGVPPRRAHFPLRNRIISGLCLGVIVVEARRRSGSLMTVRHALGQGREVFAVPGSVEGPFAEGTNQLLREGARPICSAGDVLEDLGFQASLNRIGGSPHACVEVRPVVPSSVVSGVDSTGTSVEDRILKTLKDGPATRDDLVGRTGLGVSELAGALVELELAGRIIMERDGRIYAKW